MGFCAQSTPVLRSTVSVERTIFANCCLAVFFSWLFSIFSLNTSLQVSKQSDSHYSAITQSRYRCWVLTPRGFWMILLQICEKLQTGFMWILVLYTHNLTYVVKTTLQLNCRKCFAHLTNTRKFLTLLGFFTFMRSKVCKYCDIDTVCTCRCLSCEFDIFIKKRPRLPLGT